MTAWLHRDPGSTRRPTSPRRRTLPPESRLPGLDITTTLTIDDVNQVLLDGFFPAVRSDDMPARARRLGLQELGLPYAADAAVTRHLARFLSRQASGGSGVSASIRRGPGGLACPTHVLFNGGVMKAPALRARAGGALIEDWGDEIEELDPLEITLALDGREESTIREPGDRDRHAGIVVRVARPDAAVEARAEYP